MACATSSSVQSRALRASLSCSFGRCSSMVVLHRNLAEAGFKEETIQKVLQEKRYQNDMSDIYLTIPLTIPCESEDSAMYLGNEVKLRLKLLSRLPF